MASPITPKASRAVSFSANVRVKRTLHLNNYSDEEINSCWYNDAETKSIRADALKLAKQIQVGGKFDESKDCKRGLEFLTPECQKLRMENRIRAWDAVLDEQERQVEHAIWDDETMASIYTDCCYNSVVAAAVQAVSDEQATDSFSKKAQMMSPRSRKLSSYSQLRRAH